jgi:hypothetical protein
MCARGPEDEAVRGLRPTTGLDIASVSVPSSRENSTCETACLNDCGGHSAAPSAHKGFWRNRVTARPGLAKNVVRRAVDDERIRRAVESMAKEWPEEYPAGAVKWLLLEPTGSTCPGESRP